MKAPRIIVGVVVVAVAGIAVAHFAGVFPPKSGLEGTIGAAKRYQTTQITDKDVALQDPQVQALLQSDVFQKVVSNPEFRKAWQHDAAFRHAVASGALQRAYKNAEVGRRVTADVSRKTDTEASRKVTADANRAENQTELSRHAQEPQIYAKAAEANARTQAEVQRSRSETQKSVDAASPKLMEARVKAADLERAVKQEASLTETQKKAVLDLLSRRDSATLLTGADFARFVAEYAKVADANQKVALEQRVTEAAAKAETERHSTTE